jgi:hypothetical protein
MRTVCAPIALAGPQTANLAGVAMPMSPSEFGKLIAEETEKWAKVIEFPGIKAE